MRLNRQILAGLTLALCLNAPSALAQDNSPPISLDFPLNCTLDEDCFIQQFADMDTSSGESDPFCGLATYDGHKGTDIRVRTMQDMDKNVQVLAAADGIVKGVRRNRPDRLVESEADRRAVGGEECGNGVVIDHGNNIETQYCHMKQDSPRVSTGDRVQAGDVLGYVGASGMAQFPHLHLSVRQDGQDIDPFTGRSTGEACTADRAATWWADNKILDAGHDAILLGSDLTGTPPNHDNLVRRLPSKAVLQDSATVGWVWYANLKENDRVFIRLAGPNGFEAENLSDPMNRHKASWSGYVGKRRQPQTGTYTLTSYILRRAANGSSQKISASEKTITVGR